MQALGTRLGGRGGARSVALGAAALVLAAAAVAHAGASRGRVAVVGVTFAGSVPQAAREILARRLSDGLTTARFQLVGNGDDAAAGCADASCWKQAASRLGADYLVRGTVRERQKTYDLVLEIVDARQGEVVGKSDARCDICGIEEVGERMSLAASSLRARLEALVTDPGVVVIRSRPEANVTIDGKPVGRTPLTTPLADGEHKLVLEADGYVPYERSIRPVPNVEERFDIELVHRSSGFPYATAGWTAIAVGVAAVAAGVWAVAVNGKEIACAASEKDPSGHCPYVHGTAALGAALIGVGAAAGVVGGVWLYMGSNEAPGEPRAMNVGLRGRF
jgi:TolB-like protein